MWRPSDVRAALLVAVPKGAEVEGGSLRWSWSAGTGERSMMADAERVLALARSLDDVQPDEFQLAATARTDSLPEVRMFAAEVLFAESSEHPAAVALRAELLGDDSASDSLSKGGLHALAAAHRLLNAPELTAMPGLKSVLETTDSPALREAVRRTLARSTTEFAQMAAGRVSVPVVASDGGLSEASSRAGALSRAPKSQ